MPPFQTTISCRLVAQLLAVSVLPAPSVGAQPPAVQPPAVQAPPAQPAAAQAPEGQVPHVETAAFPAAIKWSVPLSSPPAEPPLIAGDQIYVALQSGIVVAQRASDGAEAWRVELRAEAPLAADDGRVFIASGGAVYALNADRTPAWHTSVGILAAPMLAQDGWVVLGSNEELSALRAADGSVVWRQPIAGTSGRPSAEGNNLYVPLTDGRVVALELSTGTLKWERRLGGSPTEILAFADHVYVGSADKYFYCLDADDGEVAWRQLVGAVVRGMPAADTERVYAVGLDNLLRSFDRGNGALRWSPRGVPFRPTAGPVVLNEVIAVAGTTNEIRGFSRTTGKPAGHLTLPEALATLPAYAHASGVVRIAAVTGSLNQTWTLSLAESAPPAPSGSGPRFPPSR